MRRAAPTLAILACALLLTSSACKATFPLYVDENHRYDRTSALQLIDKVEAPNLSKMPIESAVKRRHEAMVALRGKGRSAEKAADLITDVLPVDTPAVPYYVETADYEGVGSVVVLEVIGPRGGRLVDRRLWVISTDGDVLITGTR